MGARLTSKERVLRALRREETDRVPVDVELTGEMRDILLHHYGFTNDEEIFRMFGRDFRRVGSRSIRPKLYTTDGRECDCWGVAGDQGTYADHLNYRPLAKVETVAEVERHPWPDPDWWDHSAIEADCDKCAGYAITGGDWAPFFCTACHMTGIGRFLELMLVAPDVAESIMSHIVDLMVVQTRRDLEASKGKIDIFFMGDDYGGKNGMLMSPEMWRRLIKPQLARLYALADEFGTLMAMHSCGSIRPIIPDMIELGLDILDPIQVAAARMDPAELKAEFGDKIMFHGGVNTEYVLPFGTPDEVYAETRHLMDTLGAGGGYVVCGSQYLQRDIPVDNVVAMYRAAGSIAEDAR